MAARLPVRLLSRATRSRHVRRNFSSSSYSLEAHNFTMPAMSPTMTEGNIASWKVKEGETFSTGDVLLEIETDKATMDVEAQDDGIMAKIFAQDGSKSVQVGTRIAVIADAGDDISSLEIPAEDSVPASSPPEKPESKAAESSPSEKSIPAKSAPKPLPSGPGQNTKYPLYPSVIALVHEYHLSDSDVSKIPATGPNNRLLKGDVLAYLGSIASDYSSSQSKRISHMGHLDLSNIKILPPREKASAPVKSAAPLEAQLPKETSVSLLISLTEVLKVQKRIQDTLGVSLPLSTFLARAVDLANDDLPLPKGAQPSGDDLFNAVLGLDSVPTAARGMYLPQIDALPPPRSTAAAAPRAFAAKTPDIIDILTGNAIRSAPRRARPAPSISAGSMAGGAMNMFTLTVPTGEEKRARTFLERMKTVLQVEPGRLVL